MQDVFKIFIAGHTRICLCYHFQQRCYEQKRTVRSVTRIIFICFCQLWKKWRNFNIWGIFHNDATLILVTTCLCKHTELEGVNENFIYRGPRQSLSFVCRSIMFQALHFWIFSDENFVWSVHSILCQALTKFSIFFLVFIPLGWWKLFPRFHIFERCSPASSSKEPFYPRLIILFEISNLLNGYLMTSCLLGHELTTHYKT